MLPFQILDSGVITHSVPVASERIAWRSSAEGSLQTRDDYEIEFYTRFEWTDHVCNHGQENVNSQLNLNFLNSHTCINQETPTIHHHLKTVTNSHSCRLETQHDQGGKILAWRVSIYLFIYLSCYWLSGKVLWELDFQISLLNEDNSHVSWNLSWAGLNCNWTTNWLRKCSSIISKLNSHVTSAQHQILVIFYKYVNDFGTVLIHH